MNEEIDFDDIEFGEPIEEREPNYRDGYIQGIYRARNIIDSKQKEIERLNNIINEFEEELEREVNIKAIDTSLEYNTYIDINNTLKTVLKRFRKLKGSDKE